MKLRYLLYICCTAWTDTFQ